MGYEKIRGVLRSSEKAGATEGIQSVEEGGSVLWQTRARKRFCFYFSRSLFQKNQRMYFGGHFEMKNEF